MSTDLLMSPVDLRGGSGCDSRSSNISPDATNHGTVNSNRDVSNFRYYCPPSAPPYSAVSSPPLSSSSINNSSSSHTREAPPPPYSTAIATSSPPLSPVAPPTFNHHPTSDSRGRQNGSSVSTPGSPPFSSSTSRYSSCSNLNSTNNQNNNSGRNNGGTGVSFGPTSSYNGYSRSMSSTQTLPRLSATETQFSSTGVGRNRKPSLATIGLDPKNNYNSMFSPSGVHAGGNGFYGVGCDRVMGGGAHRSSRGGVGLTCTCYSHTASPTALGCGNCGLATSGRPTGALMANSTSVGGGNGSGGGSGVSVRFPGPKRHNSISLHHSIGIGGGGGGGLHHTSASSAS